MMKLDCQLKICYQFLFLHYFTLGFVDKNQNFFYIKHEVRYLLLLLYQETIKKLYLKRFEEEEKHHDIFQAINCSAKSCKMCYFPRCLQSEQLDTTTYKTTLKFLPASTAWLSGLNGWVLDTGHFIQYTVSSVLHIGHCAQ